MSNNNDLLEVQKQLQAALSDSTKLESEFQAALAKIQPLRDAVHAKQLEVNSLITSFQKLTNADVPARKRRRSSGAPRKAYAISNESKISRVGKSAYSRTIKGGGSEKDAKAAQKAAEKSLAEKLGVAK